MVANAFLTILIPKFCILINDKFVKVDVFGHEHGFLAFRGNMLAKFHERSRPLKNKSRIKRKFVR